MGIVYDDTIYYILVGWDDMTNDSTCCNSVVDDCGYFRSFEKAKAKAKDLIIEVFGVAENDIVDVENGYAAIGTYQGNEVSCCALVYSLKCSE